MARRVTSNQMSLVMKAHGVEAAGVMLRKATKQQLKTMNAVEELKDWVRMEIAQGGHTKKLLAVINSKDQQYTKQFQKVDEKIVEVPSLCSANRTVRVPKFILCAALPQVRHGMSSLRDVEQRLRSKLSQAQATADKLLALSVEGIDLGPVVDQLKPSKGAQILQVVKALAARVCELNMMPAGRVALVGGTYVLTRVARVRRFSGGSIGLKHNVASSSQMYGGAVVPACLFAE